MDETKPEWIDILEKLIEKAKSSISPSSTLDPS